jgi:hypothetical protein
MSSSSCFGGFVALVLVSASCAGHGMRQQIIRECRSGCVIEHDRCMIEVFDADGIRQCDLEHRGCMEMCKW